MLTKQYREMMRQADVLLRDKEMIRFNNLIEMYKKENGQISLEEYNALVWLFNVLVIEKEKYINSNIL